MVLVDPESRGRGIGTRLLARAIEHLDALGVSTLKLDATPQGEPIYAKLGFVSEYEIERWALDRSDGLREQNSDGLARGLAAVEHSGRSPAAAPPALEDVFRWDREVFGADRSALLASLHDQAPLFT